MDFPTLVSNNSDTVIDVNRDKFTIGRGVDCNYVILSQRVSRVHCQLEFDGNFWILEDRSTNGTAVNDTVHKGTRVALKNEDVVMIGAPEFQFIFRQPDSDISDDRLAEIADGILANEEHTVVQSAAPSVQSLPETSSDTAGARPRHPLDFSSNTLGLFPFQQTRVETSVEAENQPVEVEHLSKKRKLDQPSDTSGNENPINRLPNNTVRINTSETMPKDNNPAVDTVPEVGITIELSSEDLHVEAPRDNLPSAAQLETVNRTAAAPQNNDNNIEIINEDAANDHENAKSSVTNDFNQAAGSSREGIQNNIPEDGAAGTSKEGAENATCEEGAVGTSRVCAEANARFNDASVNLDIAESELQCSICAELFIKAVTLACSHTFCKYCIYEWKKNKSVCPICRADITSMSPTIVLDNYINKMLESASEDVKKQRSEVLTEREILEKCPEKKRPKRRIGLVNMFNSINEEDVILLSDVTDDGDDEYDSNDNSNDTMVVMEPDYYEDDDDYSYEDDGDYENYNGVRGVYYGGYGRCFTCGDPGHWANGCPRRRR